MLLLGWGRSRQVAGMQLLGVMEDDKKEKQVDADERTGRVHVILTVRHEIMPVQKSRLNVQYRHRK